MSDSSPQLMQHHTGVAAQTPQAGYIPGGRICKPAGHPHRRGFIVVDALFASPGQIGGPDDLAARCGRQNRDSGYVSEAEIEGPACDDTDSDKPTQPGAHDTARPTAPHGSTAQLDSTEKWTRSRCELIVKTMLGFPSHVDAEATYLDNASKQATLQTLHGFPYHVDVETPGARANSIHDPGNPGTGCGLFASLRGKIRSSR